MEKSQKEIEIVTGDGSDLDISQVKKHLPIEKPQSNKKGQKSIIIPAEKKINSNHKDE